MNIQNDRLYAKSHEWIKFEDDGTATIGISDFAQHAMGGIVFVELPEIGDTLEIGKGFAEVESVKSVADIYAPVDGVVLEVNEELLDSPGLINEDPYGVWLVKLEKITEKGELLESAVYEQVIETVKH
ncbi:glycine cleavage system protein GcvH [Acetobacterium sp.]|uniref:glycine cleavage system protein GcvH n=1 Tax=Acetobacterium sp. TaxID=1872094 RepID=UPI0035938826